MCLRDTEEDKDIETQKGTETQRLTDRHTHTYTEKERQRERYNVQWGHKRKFLRTVRGGKIFT